MNQLPLTSARELIGPEPSYHEAVKKLFLKRYKALLAWDFRRTLINFTEFDDLRWEQEWRAVSSAFPYEAANKREQILEATAPLTPENAGWKFQFQNNMERQSSDHFGLLMEGQLAKFLPSDVQFLICPANQEVNLRDALPTQYAQHEIRCASE